MNRPSPAISPDERPLVRQSTTELFRRLGRLSTELVKKEAELARTELREDFRRELAAVKVLAVAGVCAIATIDLLLMAVVFALAERIPGWAAALIVAAVVLSIGVVVGFIGWSKRVMKPLERTQKTLQELRDDVQRAKERFT